MSIPLGIIGLVVLIGSLGQDHMATSDAVETASRVTSRLLLLTVGVVLACFWTTLQSQGQPPDWVRLLVFGYVTCFWTMLHVALFPVGF